MKTRPAQERMDEVGALAADLRALVVKLKRRLREQANTGDLTPSQVSVILRLERDGPTTVSALSRAEGVRPQSMRMTVAALEEAGHVEGRPDPGDGRQTIISLTEACHKWLTEGRAAHQDWLSRGIASKLSREEQRTLGEAARLLARIVDE